ncbi:synaptic vesicular amine transporter [Caerostris darwini]|uniref:Synaptic vesicular amine transporter n=1 Tax=Caerostris darwini TaxID=1538125 RepID=A0AAV4PGI4_9ARAC|nr:synaptic vesicular amine transporter [Caerostris darwini]
MNSFKENCSESYSVILRCQSYSNTTSTNVHPKTNNIADENRIGNKTPIFCGTLVLLLSSLLFAFGDSFYILLFARSIHGVGSAGICIGGMAAIAERYQEDCERSRFMGMIMGGIATGVLIGYPLGSVMYDFVDQKAPLLLVAGLLVLDAVFLVMVLRPRLQPEVRKLCAISLTFCLFTVIRF